MLASACLLTMVATGYVLRFPLPPGTNRTHVLWGLSRHEWGAIHSWASLGLLVVIATGLAHGLGGMPGRPAVTGFFALFLLPLVTGALSQLLPVWRLRRTPPE